MSAWSTVALSLGSAGIGAAAALTGTAMQLRSSRREHDRAEQAAWRDRAANVLGPIRGVLDDMEPEAIVEHHGRSQQTIENIGRRWWRARDQLHVFAAANPSAEISATSNDLADAVARTWASMTTLNRALQASDSGGTEAPLLERARGDHSSALGLVQELERLTRQEAPPPR
jgi:hypothetical protein